MFHNSREALSSRRSRVTQPNRPADTTVRESATAQRHSTVRAVAVGALALIVILRAADLAGRGLTSAAESSVVAQVVATTHRVAFTPTPGTAIALLARLQFAGLSFVAQAIGRQQFAITSVREGMLAVAVLGAVLLWLLARRLKLSRLAAAGTLALLALSPLTAAVGQAALPANLAVVWSLAALTLWYAPHTRPATDALALGCVLVAVFTSLVGLAVLPALAAGDWRGRSARHLGVLLAGFLVLTAAGFATRLRPALPAATTTQPISHWLALDPVLAVLAVLGAGAALFAARTRGVAVMFLLAAVAALSWPPEALAFIGPLGCLLAARLVDEGVRRQPTPRHLRHPQRGAAPLPVAITVILVLALLASWTGGYRLLFAGSRTDLDSVADAQRWLTENVSGARVLTDDVGWTQLIQSGWPATAVAAPGTCAARCPQADWVLTTAATPDTARGLPTFAQAVAHTDAAAVFPGVVISRPGITGGATEQAERARAGQALADSNRIVADPDVTALLRAGRADPRIVAAVAALAANRTIQLAALPGSPAEDAAGQPRRTVVLAAGGEQAQNLVLFFTGQRDVFQPASVHATADGVVVTYPPGAPSGLLGAFAAP